MQQASVRLHGENVLCSSSESRRTVLGVEEALERVLVRGLGRRGEERLRELAHEPRQVLHEPGAYSRRRVASASTVDVNARVRVQSRVIYSNANELHCTRHCTREM